MFPVKGESTNPAVPGVLGEGRSTGGRGVIGNGFDATGIGVLGQNGAGVAVYGNSGTNVGVHGETKGDGMPGVLGEGRGTGGRGVVGNAFDATGVGINGQNDAGDAILGFSRLGRGVVGHSNNQAGVVGESVLFDGVWGVVTGNPNAAAVSGHNPGGLAGFFEGNVTVTGTVTAHEVVLSNSDCAEDFDITGSPEIEPGTVMVIDQDGALREGQEAYDKKVAGVVSGAGDFKPGIVLGKLPSKAKRMPIALVGKVYCKVDASYSPIEMGDLLTTSPTAGHAMKVTDPLKALGSVIGKALRGLEEGQGLIPILVALQ